MANPSAALDYYIVDVFTDRALAGNPLAVVMNTAALTTEQMQSIAREFNLSETTFVERRSAQIEATEGIRTRIFTTEEELPFAGHPTLGTASVLKLTDPFLAQKSTITLAENVGPIPVAFDPAGKSLYAEMTQRNPDFGPELDSTRVSDLCGLTPDDLDPAHPPQIVSTGNGFAIVILRSLEALARLNVRQQEAAAYLRPLNGRWFYIMAPQEEGFRARMQFNGGEDPATGSAAGCAISYLVARNIVPSGKRIHLRQGVEMGRPSDLFLTANLDTLKVTNVRVGGSTVLVATGKFLLP